MTLTNNEIKDIKVIGSLENRGILLKETIKKISSQERGFLNFLKSLMSAGLPLMKNVLTPLAKSVLIPLGLTSIAQQQTQLFERKYWDWEHQYFQMKT